MLFLEISMQNQMYEISSPVDSAVRIRAIDAKESALDRYNILQSQPNAKTADFEVTPSGMIFKNNDCILTVLQIKQNGEGWRVNLSLKDEEQLYGLGDINRERLNRRGHVYRMWVANVRSYIPIPFIMSSEGWAISVNTTFEHFFDVGATDKNKLTIFSKHGSPDVTLYTGKDYAELLQRFTVVAGRPLMLPRWAMGLSFVCNTQADAHELISDALNFRREDMPCDVLGLEPGWMSKNYDESTEKKWHPERFSVPEYAAIGPHTFLGAIDRLKFKLSLWLCSDYDFTYHEERQIGNMVGMAKEKIELDTGAFETQIKKASFEDDEHFHNVERTMDTITKPSESWFEHLKKFVDQGVSAFKLDGAYQVLDHPDRVYGNGMLDEEVHNLIPLIYAKQMSKGYSEHTGKRAMIYTVGGYTGIQQYAATWAGDTGGGIGPMVSMLNNGMSGHSNTSCDLYVFSKEGIHFGFLQPWSQINSWNYWRHPWLLDDEMKEVFRDYDKLRYSLVPYFYTAAYQAYATGMPVMRSLPLVYPKDQMAYERLNEYMLGDCLLVGAYLDDFTRKNDEGEPVNFYLPDGQWYDFFTGTRYEGGREIYYTPPVGKGGALFVKRGSAIPFAEVRKAVHDTPYDTYIIRAWGANAKGVLYDDDGHTFGYQNGEYTLSQLFVDEGALSVQTEGSYPGNPNVKYVLGEVIM